MLHLYSQMALGASIGSVIFQDPEYAIYWVLVAILFQLTHKE